GGGGWESICRGAAGRTLEFACGNLFDVENIAQADLVLLETDVSSDVHPQLSRFLTGLRKGAHALTYLDLRKMWNSMPFPYRQVEVNRSLSDRFPTSWSVQRGHHFFLWSKTHPHPPRETTASSSLLQAPLDNAGEGLLTALAEGDKRRDRQGVPIGSACLRRGSLSGSGGGGDGCGRSDSSGRIGGYSGSGTVGGTVVGAGREGLAQVKGRRSGGHPKFRFPFLKCLGFGRRGRKPPLPPPPRGTVTAAAEAAAAAAYAEGLAPAGFVGVPEPTTLAKEGKGSFGGGDVRDGVGEPSLQELYLLDASGGGGGGGGGGASDRLATIAGGQVELQGAAEGGGYLEGSGRRARSGVAETERVARQSSGASRSKPRYVPPPPPPGLEVVQQGSSRGQELTEAAELGLVGSPPVGGAGGAGSSESSEGCTAM
ncbi:unnamed protein product, partial [Scytosiphon promiscuus]